MKRDQAKARAPAHLAKAGRELWVATVDEFAIEDAAGLALLQSACEARDRIEAARKSIEERGVVVTDRFGELRPNPACQIEHQARGAMARALSALRLAPEGDG